jgi:eukaryotic-like serine/threonine-protein kinase
VDMTPAVDNGTVFVGSGDRSFYAIDAASGQKKWSYLVGSGMTGPALATPIVAKNRVYFVTGAMLYALDTLTGTRNWLFDTPEKWALNPPVLREGTLFLAAGPAFWQPHTTGESFLYALDPGTGKANWTVRVEGINISGPLILKDLIFFSVQEPQPVRGAKPGQGVEVKPAKGTLYAVDAASGKTKWKVGTPPSLPGRQMLIAGKTICLNTFGNLFAFELQSGHQSWSFSKEIVTEFVADEQYIYVSTRGTGAADMLRALDLSTGKEKWSTELSGYMRLNSIRDGVIYLDGDYLLATDAATGKELWTFKEKDGPPKRAISLRLIAGSTIFLDSPSVGAMDPNSTERVMRNYPGYLQKIDVQAGKR